jgi:hypothetical protein
MGCSAFEATILFLIVTWQRHIHEKRPEVGFGRTLNRRDRLNERLSVFQTNVGLNE